MGHKKKLFYNKLDLIHGFGKYNFFGGYRVPLGCSGGTWPPPGWPGGLNGHYLPRPPWKYFWNPSKPSIVTMWRSPGHWLLWLSQKILIQLGRGVIKTWWSRSFKSDTGNEAENAKLLFTKSYFTVTYRSYYRMVGLLPAWKYAFKTKAIVIS